MKTKAGSLSKLRKKSLKLLKLEMKMGHYYQFYRNKKDYERTMNNCTQTG